MSAQGRSQILQGHGERLREALRVLNAPVLLPPVALQPSGNEVVGPQGPGLSAQGRRNIDAIESYRTAAYGQKAIQRIVPNQSTISTDFLNGATYLIVTPTKPNEIDQNKVNELTTHVCLNMLMKDLEPVQAVSAIFSLWCAVSGLSMVKLILAACERCEMKVQMCSLWDFMDVNNIELEDNVEDLTALYEDLLSAAVMVTSFLILVKQISPNNRDPYFTSRINSYKTRFGLSEQQIAYLRERVPSLATCNLVYARIGNRIPFRQMILGAALKFRSTRGTGPAKMASTLLCTLFANVEITHITLIQRYIIDDTPGLLQCATVRAESHTVLLAMARLAGMGEDAKYVRFIYEPHELPELNRSNMRMLAAFATSLAKRDFPSFSNYAPGSTTEFKQAMEELNKTYRQARPFIPRGGVEFLTHEYKENEAIMVQGALQGNSTQVSTNVVNFFAGV